MPGLRYADVLMVKAEWLARKGNVSDAVALINTVGERSFATPKPLAVGDLTAARLLQEERRGFFGELRSRIDVRRFDQLSKGERWEKPAYPTNDADILPIPQTALRADPKLKHPRFCVCEYKLRNVSLVSRRPRRYQYINPD